MKKLLIVGVSSLILFCLSASASFFWQQKQKHEQAPIAEHVESARKESATHAKPSTPSAAASSSESVPRASVRPAYNSGTEEIARMTNELRTRLASVREREEQLTARKRQVDLIQEDIRGERTALDELRTQVKSEVDALAEALQNVEKQRGTLEEERKNISKSTQEMESRVLQMQQEEQVNLKKMSGMYNSMSPESAARILQNLADTGKMDTAVKVLGMMQERQAAKVLAELTDAGLAAQLVEKLKGLRRVPPNSDGTKQ